MKKGNGYNAAAVVAEAVEKCGCLEGKFLACAERFGNTTGITHTAHPGAIHFANWVTTKTPNEIEDKMGCR